MGRLFILTACLMFSASTFAQEDVESLKQRVLELEASNKLLRASLAQTNQQLKLVSTELAAIRKAAEENGVDLKDLKKSSPTTTPASGPDPTADKTKNDAVIKAIREAAAKLEQTDGTEAQLRKVRQDAVKALDAVLRTNRVRLTYVIKDVEYVERSGTAEVSISRITLKGDTDTSEDYDLPGVYSLVLSMTKEQAEKVTKEDIITVEGVLHLAVDLDKPETYTRMSDAARAGLKIGFLVEKENRYDSYLPAYAKPVVVRRNGVIQRAK